MEQHPSGGTLRVVIDRPVGGASLRIPMSFEDFVSLGETKHHEYYEGLCVVNPPNRRHATVERNLVVLLTDHCPPSHEVLPEWGWRLGDDGPLFEPDVLVVSRDIPDTDLLRHPPLLVVEVLSPSTRDVDLGLKRASYGAGGAAWYWVVDPDVPELLVFEGRAGELVEVQRLTAGGGVTFGPWPVEVDVAALTGG